MISIEELLEEKQISSTQMFSRAAETCTRLMDAEQCDVCVEWLCAWNGLEVVYWTRRSCFLKLGEPRDLRSSKTSVCMYVCMCV